jgi:GNAT superfamily N-acetyltransferase
MRIELFDARSDGGRLRSCFDIAAAAQRLDDPGLPVRSLTSFRIRWTSGVGGNTRQAWLGVDAAGEPVGCYLLTMPELENPTMAWCDLAIAPGRRRSGAGRELLAHSISQARLAGRRRLVCEVSDGSPGAAFAAAAGASSGIVEVIRRLDIEAGLPGRLASLRAAAGPPSAGYSLVSWIGPSPADTLDDQARLSAAMADAPRDEGVEPELWDAARITELERICLGSGQQFYSVAARQDATGRLAAITQVFVEPGTPGWAFQALTAVLPDHRGHRLGLLVKVEMLDLLAAREPAVRHILTGNAGPNQHMIAINEQLGFTVAAAFRSWELDLAAR